MRFLTRSYYHINSLCANKNGLIFIFQAEKRQQLWQNGQRNGLHSFERLDNRRITESQSRHISWFGMYALNNNNTGTCTSYPSLLQRLGFTLFYDPIQEIARCGVQNFCSFEEVDIWGRL